MNLFEPGHPYLIGFITIMTILGIGFLIVQEMNQSLGNSCFMGCVEKSGVSWISLHEMCNPDLGWGCSPTPICGTREQYNVFRECVTDRCNHSVEDYVYEGEMCVGRVDANHRSGGLND